MQLVMSLFMTVVHAVQRFARRYLPKQVAGDLCCDKSIMSATTISEIEPINVFLVENEWRSQPDLVVNYLNLA